VTTGTPNSPGQGDPRGARPRADWLALAGGAVLAAAAIAAYSRTFPVPLVHDDLPSIENNPSIRHLGTAFLPPVGATVGGRPVLNLTLAANYAVSGTAVWSYHAVNLAIHALAGLALLGIVRRTLARRGDASAPLVAFGAALLWTLHPLQTESVTYVVQRAESLMGLFYLLTLYCFIRGAEARGPAGTRWQAASVGACLLGMATKEVMVSAPLIALLYDRTFLAGSFGEALRRRWRVYSALAASWLVLAVLVVSNHGRGGTAGSGTGVAWWRYALTQFPAITRYLRLCFWPRPLVFDYGTSLVSPSLSILPHALLVLALAAAALWALARRPAAGFLGAVFFAVLAPSSSIIPVATETMAEHRMYLPLAAVIVLLVAGIYRWLRPVAPPLCLALAAVLAWATWGRNETYRSVEGIWSDTVAKLPGNERAQYNLGCVLQAMPGRLNDAIARYEEALRLRPDHDEVHNNLGNCLSSLGRTQEAIAQYKEALRLNPDYVEAHNDLGIALSSLDRFPEAVVQYQEALRLNPGLYQANFNLGNALNSLGRTREAVAQYEQASSLKPDDATIRLYLAGSLLRIPGRAGEAVAQLREVLRLQPGNEEARQALARIEAPRR